MRFSGLFARVRRDRSSMRCGFIRWRDKGMWEKLLEVLIDDPNYELLIIDASHSKVHPHVLRLFNPKSN